MLEGKRILAVVPARSGSKGIPNKNMQTLRGVSLIGWAGITLGQVPWVDAKVISTDSSAYAEEGRRYGLETPFLRPTALSTDEAEAIDVARHALVESETAYGGPFDIILIIEPTSPLRVPEDVERTVRRLISSGAESVVTVSPLASKFHPRKVLQVKEDRLGFFTDEGRAISRRQQLSNVLCWRNGVCYALTRDCLMGRRAIFTEQTLPEVIERQLVNIDDPVDLAWAEFLLSRLEVQGGVGQHEA